MGEKKGRRSRELKLKGSYGLENMSEDFEERKILLKNFCIKIKKGRTISSSKKKGKKDIIGKKDPTSSGRVLLRRFCGGGQLLGGTNEDGIKKEPPDKRVKGA